MMAEARADIWLDELPRIDISDDGRWISITEHGQPEYNHPITIFLRTGHDAVRRAAEAFNAVIDEARAGAEPPAQAAE